MERKVRYDAHTRRFFCALHPKDVEGRQVLHRIEGRRWHKSLKSWSTPASVRAWKKLDAGGFTMLQYGGGPDYLARCHTIPSGERIPAQYGPITLRSYQREGVAWLRARPFALLGDEPGFGKTYQAVAWAADAPRVVVVCPKVVIPQWVEVITAMVGETPTIGTYDGRWSIFNPEKLGKVSAPTTPFHLIVDEAHWYRNERAQRTKRVLALGEHAHQIVAMTGTPIVSRPKNIWPLYVLLRERERKEFFPWALRYTGAEQHDFGWDFSGATHLDELRDDLQHFTLMRKKADYLTQLPPKQYLTLHITAVKQDGWKLRQRDDEVQGLLDRGISLGRGDGLAVIQQLRMDAAFAKVQHTAEWCVAQGVPDVKIVIIGEFVAPLRAVGETITKLTNGECGVVYGLDNEDVSASAHRFWTDPTVGAYIGTYAKSGVGLNLQCANTIVLHDLPWTPDQLLQAEDRVHRDGQSNPVLVVTVLSGSSTEARMLDGLRQSKDIIAAVQPVAH